MLNRAARGACVHANIPSSSKKVHLWYRWVLDIHLCAVQVPQHSGCYCQVGKQAQTFD